MSTQRVPLALTQLVLDAGTQIREWINQDAVDRYAEAIEAGEKLPPLSVYTDGVHYWLVDGFHRYYAYSKIDRKQIQVELEEGSLPDAIAAACRVNREHDTAGLARTNADKRRAVLTLLRLEDWHDKSTRMIAEHCGVGHMIVSRIKNELYQRDSSPPETVQGKDGKRRPATHKPKEPKTEDRPVDEEQEPESADAPSVYVLQKDGPYLSGHDLKPFYTVPQWEALSHAEQLRTLHVEPQGKFNRTNDNVEWALWTWNPVTGCEHNCPYCYARDIANRYYAGYGFTPVLHPSRLHIPANSQPPQKAEKELGLKNVFVCSMADLFGKWVPKEWIQAVLHACTLAPQWNFLFLTKFPARLAEFPFPDNAWVGTSVDTQARVAAAEKAFRQVKAKVKWLSCEPLLEPLKFTSLDMFQWVVIGGASRSEQTPEYRPLRKWVLTLESAALQAGCQIYEKTNLHGEDRLREYPGFSAVEEPPMALEKFDYPLLARGRKQKTKEAA